MTGKRNSTTINSKITNKSNGKRNGWDVLHACVEGLFYLINSAKIYPAFGLLAVALMGMLIWKLPRTEVASILKIILNEFLVGKGMLLVILLITNLLWAYINRREKNIYARNIEAQSKTIHDWGKTIDDQQKIIADKNKTIENYRLKLSRSSRRVQELLSVSNTQNPSPAIPESAVRDE